MVIEAARPQGGGGGKAAARLGGKASNAAAVGLRGLAAAEERSELRKTPGFYRRSWSQFRRNEVAMAALVVFGLIVLFVLSAPLISNWSGFTPYENHLSAKLSMPGTNGYVLGADGNGRDVLTRLAYGGQISLMIAGLATFATLFIGGAVGLASGYFGGKVDFTLMRLVDVMLAIPSLPLLILIAVLFSPGPVGLALVLAAVSWPGVSRIIRGETLALRGRDYVEAARVVGASAPRIIARHVLPNVAPLIVVYASLIVPVLIVDEAALSFIGLGVQVPLPSWGNMLGEALPFIRLNATNLITAGLMIYVSALSLSLIGSGIRDAFDPRLGD